MEKKFKRNYFVPVLVVILSFYIIINNYVRAKNEFEGAYNFSITRIIVTPTKTLEFFNGNEKIVLWNYIISEKQGVKIGDIIYREKCSNYLYVYRITTEGKQLYLKVPPKGMFTFFCN